MLVNAVGIAQVQGGHIDRGGDGGMIPRMQSDEIIQILLGMTARQLCSLLLQLLQDLSQCHGRGVIPAKINAVEIGLLFVIRGSIQFIAILATRPVLLATRRFLQMFGQQLLRLLK